MTKTRTLLIDGDILCFQAASAVEQETQWGTWCWTLHSDIREALPILEGTVDRLLDGLAASRVIFALTDENNWRKQVMTTYKLNRVDKRKPLCYGALREYVAEKYTTFQRPTLEGDDVLGILATSSKLVEGEKIIVSIDKDFQGVPGKLVRDMETLEIEEISESQADYFHMLQTLTGDATDGYPGCPKYGPVTAAKLLDVFWQDGVFHKEAAWDDIVKAYDKAGLSETVALQNARVARICRASDYDFKEKCVRLWNPPRT